MEPRAAQDSPGQPKATQGSPRQPKAAYASDGRADRTIRAGAIYTYGSYDAEYFALHASSWQKFYMLALSVCCNIGFASCWMLVCVACSTSGGHGPAGGGRRRTGGPKQNGPAGGSGRADRMTWAGGRRQTGGPNDISRRAAADGRTERPGRRAAADGRTERPGPAGGGGHADRTTLAGGRRRTGGPDDIFCIAYPMHHLFARGLLS